MTRPLRAATFLPLWLALPAIALASGDAGHAPVADYPGLLRHGINLLALIIILVLALRGPLSDFLQFRRSEVKDQLESAREQKTTADAKYAELSLRLEHFSTELATLRAQVQLDADREREALEASSRRATESLRLAAERAISEEIRQAREDLKADAAELSVRIAEDLLRATISEADQSRLTRNYLDQVGETARS